jgi:signal transduction histidine kinase
VVYDGRGPVPEADGSRAGHGLVGIRERIAVFGGWVDHGTMPGGGFRVRAGLPLPREATLP